MPFSCILPYAQILDLYFVNFPMMLSCFCLKYQIAIIVFAPFVSDRWNNFQCLRCSWSEISFCISGINCSLSGCCFIYPYVNLSLLIIYVIRAIGWQIFLVQSTFECARWTLWISLDAEIFAICPLTTVVIVVNAQYAVKPIFWFLSSIYFSQILRRFDLRNSAVVIYIGS